MIQLGSDPEIMGMAGNAVIPAWLWLPAEPKPKPHGTHAYWDGVQAEISTPPAKSSLQLTSYIRDGLRTANAALKAKAPGAALTARDVVYLPEETRFKASSDYIMLGCAPSDNAYSIPPIDIGDPRLHPMRYSGVHLHFSTDGALPAWWPEGNVVVLDKLLSIPLTALGRGLEDPKRRVAYGRPGEFRVSGKRLEYRTPGAFLLSSPAIFRFAVELGRLAFELSLRHKPSSFNLPDPMEAILECDADWASVRLREYHKLFYPLVSRCVTKHNVWWDTLLKGAAPSGAVSKPVEEAWNL